MAWEAIGKSSVAALAGTNAETLRDEWYDMAVALIGHFAGIYNIGTSEVVVDEIDGTGVTSIKVTKPPIGTLTSVEIDDVLIDSGYYTHTDSYVILKDDIITNVYGLSRYFTEGTKNVKITYTSGRLVDYRVALVISLIIKELANLKTSEGAESRLQFFAPGRSLATQAPLLEYGLHGKIKGIIDTLLPTRFKAG